jgi:sugar/nucleoside kinase (ribokinase family)
MTDLKGLKPAEDCRWDCVALGEVMLRFDPGEGRVRNARQFQVWEGGGEYNVARGLSSTFGHATAVLTALPRNELGLLAQQLIQAGGVDSSQIVWREYDGIGRNTRMGLNFTERGFGVRAPLGVSDRAYSAASQLRADEYDWDAVFGVHGVRWLHTGGIFAALSEHSAQTAIAAVRAARRHGVAVSYDLNYRASLWNSHPDPDAARQANCAIAAECDLLVGDEYSFAACLGIETADRRADPADSRPFRCPGGAPGEGAAERAGLRRHPARPGLGLGQPLGRGAVDQRRALCDAGQRGRRAGPRRRRRRLRLGTGLGLHERARSAGGGRLRRRAWSHRHDHPGRQTP